MKHKKYIIKVLETKRDYMYKAITRTFAAGGDRGSARIQDVKDCGEQVEVIFSQIYTKAEHEEFKNLQELENMILDIKQEQWNF